MYCCRMRTALYPTEGSSVQGVSTRGVSVQGLSVHVGSLSRGLCKGHHSPDSGPLSSVDRMTDASKNINIMSWPKLRLRVVKNSTRLGNL